jgi:hypothetical protein
MLATFAHDAVLSMNDNSDTSAPGAAITLALCESWTHESPCPLAAHHNDAVRGVGAEVRLRILFATEPASEEDVPQRISAALTRGRLTAPDSLTSTWQLRTSSRSEVADEERRHADRLARG